MEVPRAWLPAVADAVIACPGNAGWGGGRVRRISGSVELSNLLLAVYQPFFDNIIRIRKEFLERRGQTLIEYLQARKSSRIRKSV